MILFNTSVLIDARDPDSPFHEWAKQQIAEAVVNDEAGTNTVAVADAAVRAKDRQAVPTTELRSAPKVTLPVPGSERLRDGAPNWFAYGRRSHRLARYHTK